MQVNPDSAAGSHAARRPDLLLLLPPVASINSAPIPRSISRRKPAPVEHAHRRTIYLPDASRDRPRPARHLPHLRHGARAHGRRDRRRREPRASRHAPPLLGLFGFDSPGLHLRHDDAPQPQRDVLRNGAVHAGRPVGRMAVLRARLAVDRHAQPQHVHADRTRHRRRLLLQPGRRRSVGRARRVTSKPPP